MENKILVLTDKLTATSNKIVGQNIDVIKEIDTILKIIGTVTCYVLLCSKLLY